MKSCGQETVCKSCRMSRNIDEDMARIGAKLRAFRMEKGWSMNMAYDVVEKYGVKLDPSYLSRMERGKVSIPLRTLFALADFLNVHPGQLLEPNVMDAGAEVAFLFADKSFLKNILALKHKLGEEEAREHLVRFSEQTLTMIEDKPSRGKAVRAAQPAKKKSKTDPMDKGRGN